MYSFSSPLVSRCSITPGKEMDLDIIITLRGFSFAPLLSVNLTSKLVLLIPLPYGGKQGPACRYLACYDDEGLSHAVRGHSELD